VPVIPTMLMSIVPIKTQTWMYAVPLMGQQVSMLRLLRGDPVADSSLVLCFATTTLAVMLAGVVTARIYQSERLAISA